MDFIVSYYLHKKVKVTTKLTTNVLPKQELEEKTPINSLNPCDKCGQNPYFCTCHLSLLPLHRKFDFEKSEY